MITTRTGRTEQGQAVVELLDGDAVVLKAYANPEGTKVRIVLPELADFTQTAIKPELHLVEFMRSAARARRELKK